MSTYNEAWMDGYECALRDLRGQINRGAVKDIDGVTRWLDEKQAEVDTSTERKSH